MCEEPRVSYLRTDVSTTLHTLGSYSVTATIGEECRVGHLSTLGHTCGDDTSTLRPAPDRRLHEALENVIPAVVYEGHGSRF